MEYSGMQISELDKNQRPYYDNEVIELLKQHWSRKRKSILLADEARDVLPAVLPEFPGDSPDLILATDIEHCLPLVEQHQPDLLLIRTDLLEPRHFALVSAPRANPALHSIAVLLISAQSTQDTRAECLEAGADDHLSSPYEA